MEARSYGQLVFHQILLSLDFRRMKHYCHTI